MSAFSAAAQDEDGDTIKALRARVASLEALLCGEPGFYITLPRSVVEQALEALNSSMPHNNDMDHDWPSHIAARRALRAALEQPQVEQEPVAWIENIGGGVSYNPYHEAARKLPDGVRFDLYTHPQNLNCKSNQARLATLWGYEKPQPKRARSQASTVRMCPSSYYECSRGCGGGGCKDFEDAHQRSQA